MSQDDDQASTPSSDHDQGPGPTADEIGEQIVDSYFVNTWGARPLDATSFEMDTEKSASPLSTRARVLSPDPVELNDFEQPASPPNAIYIGGLIKAADIIETLIPQSEPARQLPRAKIPAEVLRRRDEIRVLAVEVLRSPRKAAEWLDTPLRFALDGRKPAELLLTLEGCDKVEQVLKTLYS